MLKISNTEDYFIEKAAINWNYHYMDLFRSEFKQLSLWYEGPLRKSPCVLYGARQVGKSTLAERFAQQSGREFFSVNFWKDTDKVFPSIFVPHSHAKDIISKLEIHFNRSVRPESAILILDEIQEHPPVYSLFKTLKEDSTLPVIATGSYLKLFLSQSSMDIELPIGCTHEFLVTPMTFADFLRNAHESLFDIFQKHPLDQVVDPFYHQQLLGYYYEYLFTGGMPEVVHAYLEIRSKSRFEAAQYARQIQTQLLSGYNNDFLTFNRKKFVTGRNIAEKLALAFETIPKELAKYRERDEPVGRFKFTSLGEHEEFRRISHVFDYLSLSGLIIKSHVVKEAQYPMLNEDQSKNAFKCFYFDVGLLQAALDIPYQKIIQDELSYFKGPIAENFVAQQLFAIQNRDLYSWKEGNQSEVEFLYDSGEGLIPIEVKASQKSSPSKSLMRYIDKYKPPLAIKVAPRNFGREGHILSIPIYFIERVPSLF